jgi:hypothetical protein
MHRALKNCGILSPKNESDRWQAREGCPNTLTQDSLDRISAARTTNLALPHVATFEFCQATVIWIEVQIYALAPGSDFLIRPNDGLKIVDRFID